MARSFFKLGSVLIFLLFTSLCAASFSPCKVKDDKCLAKNIELAIRSFRTGSEEYGLKPLDPLEVPKVTIDAGDSAVQLIQNYDNIQIKGLSDCKIEKAHYDVAKNTLLFKGKFPEISQQGHYKVDGKLLSLPVTGDGQSTLDLENAEIIISIQFENQEKGGKIYLKIKSLLASIIPKRMVMHFDNLFNGNKLLGDNINKVLNEEWKTLYTEVQPSTEKQYAEIWRTYAQQLLDQVPVDEMFLK